MARRPRLFAPGLLYHVIARGNQRQATFLGDADYDAYLHRLAVYRARYGVSLHAYCLMPNHVHLLARTGTAPLAKFMQGLQQSYTQWFNRVHEKVGHVFQGRYRAIVCDSDEYLVTLVRYIHLNPVRAGLAPEPHLYRYSGHRALSRGPAHRADRPRPGAPAPGRPGRLRTVHSGGRRRRSPTRPLRDEGSAGPRRAGIRREGDPTGGAGSPPNPPRAARECALSPGDRARAGGRGDPRPRPAP